MNVVTFFNFLTHILILLGIFAMLAFITATIRRGKGEVEKMVRLVSLFTGFLIYVGARAVGLSVPSLMMNQIQDQNPLWIFFVGVILPAAFGSLVAWFCIKAAQRSEDLSARLIILINTFVIVLFTDIYLRSYAQTVSGEVNKYLLPNMTFTISLSLYAIFKYERSPDEKVAPVNRVTNKD